MDDPDDLVGQVIAGRYLVRRELGEGGMGTVWQAEQLDLRRPVALKVLPRHVAFDGNAVRRFKREAEAAAALAHPHIAQLLDFVMGDDAPPTLVMELLRGESLDKAMARGPLAAEKIATIARQVLSALSAVHARNIVHRDIKPANIFLVEGAAGPHVKVLDFGVAKMLDSAPITATGVVLGTPLYMAPEQAAGGEVTFATDLYALGVCMYEMASGRAPWGELSGPRLIREIVLSTPPPLSEVAPGAHPLLLEVVSRALEKEPSARYASAKDMSDALAPLDPSEELAKAVAPTDDVSGNRALALAPTVGVVPSGAPGAAAPPRPRRRGGSRLGLFAFAALVPLLVGAIGLLAWAYHRAHAPRPVPEDDAGEPLTTPAPSSTPPPASVPEVRPPPPTRVADAAPRAGASEASDIVVTMTRPEAPDHARAVDRVTPGVRVGVRACAVSHPGCPPPLDFEIIVRAQTLGVSPIGTFADTCFLPSLLACVENAVNRTHPEVDWIAPYRFEIHVARAAPR